LFLNYINLSSSVMIRDLDATPFDFEGFHLSIFHTLNDKYHLLHQRGIDCYCL